MPVAISNSNLNRDSLFRLILSVWRNSVHTHNVWILLHRMRCTQERHADRDQETASSSLDTKFHPLFTSEMMCAWICPFFALWPQYLCSKTQSNSCSYKKFP